MTRTRIDSSIITEVIAADHRLISKHSDILINMGTIISRIERELERINKLLDSPDKQETTAPVSTEPPRYVLINGEIGTPLKRGRGRPRKHPLIINGGFGK